MKQRVKNLNRSEYFPYPLYVQDFHYFRFVFTVYVASLKMYEFDPMNTKHVWDQVAM